MKLSGNQLKITGVVAAIAVVIVCLFILKPRCNVAPQVVATLDSAFYWKNMYDKEVVSLKGYAAQFEVMSKRTADSIAKVYNTKAKYLEEVILANTSSITDVPAVDTSRQYEYYPVSTVPANCPPQIKHMRQSFRSTYYDAQVQVGDKSYLRIKRKDTLSALWSTVKEGGLFNRRKYLQLDLNFADTSNKVVGLHAYRQGPMKPKRFGVGVQAGYEFDGRRFRPYFGAGISYNIIRF